MFKQYLSTIEGITNYPMFLVIVFFVFFVIVSVTIMATGKKQLQYISELPLNDSNSISDN